MFRTYLLILVLSLLGLNLSAQDEAETNGKGDLIPSMSAFYAFEIPGGDLSSRFGFNNKVGAAFTLKFENNWLVILEGGYMFGEDLKEEAFSILDPLKTTMGQITSQYGTPGKILLNERGYSLMVKGGKILPFLQTNKNSGPVLIGGIGFLQHQIKIENDGNDTPQVSEEYRKGYDHLTNGIAFSEFVGYRHYAKNKMMNFYIGVEFTQAITKNRRGFNYNTLDFDKDQRLDMLTSLKFGIVIPFSRRVPDAFYAY